MHLKSLNIINYKNIADKQLLFNKKINCFVGHNGVGKTNILDAIYHLSQGKSYFNPNSAQNIKHNEDFFVIDGVFSRHDNDENIVCSLKKGDRKIIKRNGKIYKRFSEHIGLIPIVIISPTDQDLISEGSEVRRKFIDIVISQQDNLYLQNLIYYQKILSQRNALLKHFSQNHIFDIDTLSVYNEQLHQTGSEIFLKRQSFMEDFKPTFAKYYTKITNNNESVNLSYISQLQNKKLIDLLQENTDKDRALQYTSSGIHKDDLIFEIEKHPLKKYGSQGQQKSFLVALKLAQFEFIKKQCNEILPILLFDDIFDKLDSTRVQQIVKMVNDETFGQLFITDTDKDRTELIVKTTNLDYDIFEIK